VARKPTSADFAPRHRVAVLALDGVVPFDLSVPCEVFDRAQRPDGSAPYVVHVCGVTRRVKAKPFDIHVAHGLSLLRRADTVVLPGIDDVGRPVPELALRAIRAAAKRGARIASICSGAFVLAATGLLDGRRATTHWLAAAELARRYPTIRVDAGVLYVDEGALLTSAGAAAGLDLCLHLVRRDFGAAVASQTARASVMPLERHGGQAQFIEHVAPEVESGSLEPLLRWMEQNVSRTLDLRSLARHAKTSTRTLSRRFRAQVGRTPAQWVVHARVRRAQSLLERTSRSIERIADDVGFGSTPTFRAQFRRVVGTSPLAYRAAFRR